MFLFKKTTSPERNGLYSLYSSRSAIRLLRSGGEVNKIELSGDFKDKNIRRLQEAFINNISIKILSLEEFFMSHKMGEMFEKVFEENDRFEELILSFSHGSKVPSSFVKGISHLHNLRNVLLLGEGSVTCLLGMQNLKVSNVKLLVVKLTKTHCLNLSRMRDLKKLQIREIDVLDQDFNVQIVMLKNLFASSKLKEMNFEDYMFQGDTILACGNFKWPKFTHSIDFWCDRKQHIRVLAKLMEDNVVNVHIAHPCLHKVFKLVLAASARSSAEINIHIMIYGYGSASIREFYEQQVKLAKLSNRRLSVAYIHQ